MTKRRRMQILEAARWILPLAALAAAIWSWFIQPAVARDFPTRTEFTEAMAAIRTHEAREHESIRESQRQTQAEVREELRELRGDVKQILKLMIEEKKR